MSTNFLEAYERHLEDAVFLYNDSRFANAGQLYGLAAECGLKELMIKFGMPMANGMPNVKDDRVHIEKVWQRYQSYQSGAVNGASFSLTPTNPFTGWSVSQRYWEDACFNQAATDGFKNGAALVAKLIHRAKIEGLL